MAFSYCEYCKTPAANPLHVQYHDTEYGFPSQNDTVLFERLILEINQAGLSWETILKKRENFKAAFKGFDVRTVAQFNEDDRARLLSDAGIIRNRMKVDAAIHNANVVLGLVATHGSFSQWLDSHHPLTREEWTKLFKKTFRFTGGEIVNEFLMSLGYLAGSHDDDCPVLQVIRQHSPPWARDLA